jgi:hypothetical protein
MTKIRFYLQRKYDCGARESNDMKFETCSETYNITSWNFGIEMSKNTK